MVFKKLFNLTLHREHNRSLELGDIEKLLVQHPDVLEAVVIFEEDKNKSKCLVAYIVSDLIPDRVPYQTTCQVEFEQHKITLSTEDISENGFCLEGVPSFFEKGKPLRLRVLLPSEVEERWLKGTVVWHHEHKAGVQLELTDIEQNAIQKSIDYLLEKQGFLKVLQRIITGRLRKYLASKLSDDMIPDVFIILQTIPLKNDGQINYSALPASEKKS
jgi:acyl-CoA synthetase (AMP-forming)/AMP-acid ligase II